METLWKRNQADGRQSGKHGIFGGIPWNLLKCVQPILKFLETSPKGLSVILVKKFLA